MSPVHSTKQSARPIFTKALGLNDPTAREAYLDEACGSDLDLRREIERLLAAQLGERTSPLDAVEAAFGPEQTVAPTAIVDAREGHQHPQIGPYRLLEQIGEGGFGTVYMAEQTAPVRRRVALNIIKPGMDSREVIARFEAERQALAMMDHPHIARILDGGTTPEGRPYFAMELVRGIPITEYCDEVRLTNDERLKLFIDICRAIQHAHQKGIIHRDLKPSNVMVTMHDDKAVIKVIDFGIAKALSQPLTDRTLFTGYQQLLGTPLYMSPEQAQLNGIDVDTRSDVYSLGVLLYELLTGTTPFAKDSLANVGFDELRRVIREQEPPRPSARVTTLDAQARSTIADRRGIDQRKITDQLRGELDWIVMKSLEKDRNRRYESPGAFAADVQRYLSDEPVEALPPSAIYWLRKLARRHRTALATAGVLAAVLVAATAMSLWQTLRATQASTLAQAERQRAEANLRTASEAVDRMLLRVADERLAAIPTFEPVRRELLQDAIEFYARLLEQQAGDSNLRLSSARAWSKIANLHYLLGQWDEVRPAYEQSCLILDELSKENPDDPACTTELAVTYQTLAYFEFHRAWSAKSAEPYLLRAISLRTALANIEPDVDEHKLALLALQDDLLDVQERLGRKKLTNSQKEERLREDLRKCEALVHRHPDDLAYRRRLASIHVRLFLLQATEHPQVAEQTFHAAEVILQSVLEAAPTDRETRRLLAWANSSWAYCLRQWGRHAEAEEVLRGVILACEEVMRLFGNLPDDQAMRAYYRNELADYLESTGRLDAAESLYRQTLDELGFHGIGQRGNALDRLARMLIRQKRFAEAAAKCQSVVDAAEQDLLDNPSDPTLKHELLLVRLLLMEILELEGRNAEAARVGAAIPRTLTKLDDYFRAAAMLGRTARLAETDEPQAATLCRQRARELLQEASVLLEANLSRSAEPGWYPFYQLALCRLGNGNRDGYRAACAEMLRRFGQSPNVDELHFTAWSCSLAPGAVDDYVPVIAMARREVEARESDAGALLALGASLFRAGKFAEALESLTKSAAAAPSGDRLDPPYVWFFLAMANDSLGRREEAGMWFAKAAAYSEQALSGAAVDRAPLPWNRRLTLELLAAEAAAMLE